MSGLSQAVRFHGGNAIAFPLEEIMNKLWSVVFFGLALTSTWYLVHSDSAIGSETHSGIQHELAQLLVRSVQNKRPDVQNLRIVRMWTEAISEHKVRAVFAYTFSDTSEGQDQVNQRIEGEAVLHRQPSDDTRLDKWVLQNVKTTGDSMDFSEGMVVTPDAPSERDE